MRYGTAPAILVIVVAGALASRGAAAEPPVTPAPSSAAAPAPAPTPPATQTAAAPAAPAEPEPPPRPPLPAGRPPAPPPWVHHVEVGPLIGLATRPATTDRFGAASPVRLDSALAWGGYATIDLFRFLRLTAYVVGADHPLELPVGSLGLASRIDSHSVHTVSLGLRLSPTLVVSPRVRIWLTGGAGWGHFEYARMTVNDAGGPFIIRDRQETLAEYPLGAGASVELVPGWLRIQLEGTGALHSGQQGNAVDVFQAVDAAGKRRDVGPLPLIQATFVQTLGLSLVL